MKISVIFLWITNRLTLPVLFFWILSTGSVWAGQKNEADSAPVLTINDCVKCHEGPVSDIAARGMAHKNKVTCVDCHVGHPPEKRDIIPACGKCHRGRSHFELDNCLLCHVNPHAPLDIRVPKDLTAPCLTCHEDKGRQLREQVSSHSKFSCTTFCHPSRHGNVPTCFKCHKPHSDAMDKDDCRKCHKAHMPLDVRYGPDVSSESCGACHQAVFQLLAATPTKHRGVKCVTCHTKVHKTIPRCADCHGKPHPAIIHQKYPVCGACHGIAHSVNPGKIRKLIP